MDAVTRRLAAAAVAVSAVAILMSAGGGEPTASRPPASPPARAAMPTPTPAATSAAAPQPDATLERTAVAYALAARNWSGDTYLTAWRRQHRLTGGGYRRRFERARPTRAELAGLQVERASSIAVLAGPPRAFRVGRAGRVVVELHERTATAGQSVIARTRNRVILSRHGGQWRVTGWTILPGGHR